MAHSTTMSSFSMPTKMDPMMMSSTHHNMESTTSEVHHISTEDKEKVPSMSSTQHGMESMAPTSTANTMKVSTTEKPKMMSTTKVVNNHH
jgi:hypothetical protein